MRRKPWLFGSYLYLQEVWKIDTTHKKIEHQQPKQLKKKEEVTSSPTYRLKINAQLKVGKAQLSSQLQKLLQTSHMCAALQ